MINSVTIVNYLGESTTIELRSPEKSGFFIKKIHGITPVKAEINISEALYMDGGYYNSARKSTRNIVFELGFYNNGSVSIEELRQQCYRIFPVKRKVLIQFKTDLRDIYTTGYVESNDPDIFSNNEGTVVSVICEEATFRDTNLVQSIFTGITPEFEFPFENASLTQPTLVMGTINNTTVKSVIYDGTDETGVIITLDFIGGVTNPNVFNNTTGQKMSLISTKIVEVTGSNIIAGDKIVISTVKNNKYITLFRGTASYNIMSALSSDSSWIVIRTGDNIFVYTATSGVSSILFSIGYNRLYEGI